MNPNGTTEKPSPFGMTEHAIARMYARRLSLHAIQVVMAYGREVHTRGAVLFVIGRNEVERARRINMDLSSLEGIHVVCTSDGAVMTVYRNRNLRDLRPHSRTRSYRYRLTAEQKNGQKRLGAA